MQDVLFLQSDDLVDLLSLEDFIDAIRDGYHQHATGGQAEPRTKLFHPIKNGMLMYYGALLPDSGVMGTFDYIGEFKDGDSWFLTFLADSNTGDPLAIVDSPSINPYKTGATGAVGVDALAREDASVVGVIGTGMQAKGQLFATAHVREVTEVRAYSPTRENRVAFANNVGESLDADVHAVETATDAVCGADIVITATTATDPVFEESALSPGTHITAMGQSHPERRELDAETIARAVYVPDQRLRAELASGEYLLAQKEGVVSEDSIHAELGEVIAGTVPGRTDAEQITVFDSGGTGIETVAATYRVYEKAKEAGRGIELSMTSGDEGTPNW